MINCFIFTALPCEAKAFITHFKLKKDLDCHSFSVYVNNNIVLTVTGSGKVAMAGGLAYSLALFESVKNPVLINLGIAGHQTATLGQLFISHKITDTDNGKNYYPQLIIKNECSSYPICTVSKPEQNYQENCLYDMEASGFYEIATRFTTTELIQVFKVISDNNTNGLELINAKIVTIWMMAVIEHIADSIEKLQFLATTLIKPELRYYAWLQQQYYFNVNHSHQLKALLQRWDVLTDYAELNFTGGKFKHAKAVLHWLQQQIDKQLFSL